MADTKDSTGGARRAPRVFRVGQTTCRTRMRSDFVTMNGHVREVEGEPRRGSGEESFGLGLGW